MLTGYCLVWLVVAGTDTRHYTLCTYTVNRCVVRELVLEKKSAVCAGGGGALLGNKCWWSAVMVVANWKKECV